ncbi:dimethylarginine dimethylaminohydrolase [Octadecabacter sp. 1_MG-2023]|uniref:arginine deiminase-related protein n=1 Tax=unclassified Octadecabacter TaxID=196158 RepID=UPI001C087DE0|nr:MULTISPECIES: arginine deiminase-related protein [unclassified Octadecabacter]MBU2993743.1 dimethylarginine dimethylaminohydrolase [Octadecabacter sp. B2R22]MDO6735412.1 dimethylarginine dimethylaminohydrolase [Octadecabacter sp. 1_MG-2023]
MSHPSFEFSHALCRLPASSVTDGLRAQDQGDPDPFTFAAEHAAYVSALRDVGCDVTLLPKDETFPDSVFIEDPALVLNGTAIVLRPGADTRLGEAAALRPSLLENMTAVIDLETDGYVDGGDILCTDDRVLLGLSARTNVQGAEDLRPIVESLGYSLEVLQTPPEILHFKTESSLLDHETVLATPALAASGAFKGLNVIETVEGEEAAANAIRVNDYVFLSAGHPKTAEKLQAAGYMLKILNTSQAELVDGGLSCMSLRYSR